MKYRWHWRMFDFKWSNDASRVQNKHVVRIVTRWATTSKHRKRNRYVHSYIVIISKQLHEFLAQWTFAFFLMSRYVVVLIPTRWKRQRKGRPFLFTWLISYNRHTGMGIIFPWWPTTSPKKKERFCYKYLTWPHFCALWDWWYLLHPV